eukprot:209866-Pyramimonas_sp.AAC.1
MMLHGEFKEWASFSRALDDSEYWKAEKSEWRRAAQGDMTEKDNIVAMQARLDDPENIDTQTFTDCATSLTKWLKCCRSGTVVPVLQAYLKANE